MFKQKSDSAASALSPADAVQQARTRARRRLIGAIVLLGIGIIGFPLVFETQPRPIPVDIPIEIPRKETAPPLVAPPAPATPSASNGGSARAAGVEVPKNETITESRGDAGRESPSPPRVAAAAATPPASASVTSPARVQASSPAIAARAASTAEPVRQTTTSSEPAVVKSAQTSTTAEGERARALLEGRPVAAAESQRFVVQVGAFADAEAARETRLKVEKLGLKTYTQVAQTPGGSRIRVRVGPFASRADADVALAKAKSAGLAAVVLTL